MEDISTFSDADNRSEISMGFSTPLAATDFVDPVMNVPAVVPQPTPARPMQKGRFLAGLMFASSGIALMLIVAMGALHSAGANGRLSLPAVGVCMVIGLMLLGGGFGVMATAAPRFDDNEFERLVQEGSPPMPDQTFDSDQAVEAAKAIEAEQATVPRFRKDDAEPTRKSGQEALEQSMA